jgi:hypothetical protein
MAKHVLMALTNAAEGKDAEFNTWYESHLKDLLALPGFVSVQRYTLSEEQRTPTTPYRYLAIYQLDTDDLKETMDALAARSAGMDWAVLDTNALLVNAFTESGPLRMADSIR